MSKPPLFRTEHLFDNPQDAIDFFEKHRVNGVDPLPDEVKAFLGAVAEYDTEALYNVQPGYSTHYISVALPTDKYLWLFAKPHGVTFSAGSPKNVEAIMDMWDEAGEPPDGRILPSDVWFPPEHLDTPGAMFALRLAAAWGAGS